MCAAYFDIKIERNLVLQWRKHADTDKSQDPETEKYGANFHFVFTQMWLSFSSYSDDIHC